MGEDRHLAVFQRVKNWLPGWGNSIPFFSTSKQEKALYAFRSILNQQTYPER